METFKKNWFAILLILAIGGGLFYWYGYRPTQIRHDCSWVLRQNFIPREEACTEPPPPPKDTGIYEDFNDYFEKRSGGVYARQSYDHCLAQQEQRKIRLQEPKEYWGKATDKEYDFCIQESGLR